MQGRDFSLRHDQIPSSVFRRFYNVVDDDERLYATYDALLKELWITKYWALFWSLLVLVLTVMSSGFLALPMWICAGFVSNNMQRSYLRRHGYRYVGESDRSTPNSPVVAVAR